jgi:hypothetical protein
VAESFRIERADLSPEQEEEFKMRGKEMINNVIADPKFLVNKRVKLPKEKMNPNFFFPKRTISS